MAAKKFALRGIVAAAVLAVAVIVIVFGFGRGDAAPQRALVTLTADVYTDVVASELVADGAIIRATYERAASAFVAVGPEGFADHLVGDDRVEEVRLLDRADPGFETVHSPTVDLPTDRPVLYVIDGPLFTDHSWFAGGGVTAVRGFEAYAYERSDDRPCDAHATAVASAAAGAAGVARDVTVVGLGVTCGYIDVESLLGAFEWMLTHHPEDVPGVVNMSLSVRTNPAFVQAFERTVAAGLPVFTSAGNRGVDTCTDVHSTLKPDIAHVAMIVGSTRQGGTRAGTNYGPCIDVFARGTDIMAASTEGDLMRVANAGPRRRFNGTSLSTPRVAGMGLRALQDDPSLTVEDVYTTILDEGKVGRVRDAGPGSPDLFVEPRLTDWWYETRHEADHGDDTTTVTTASETTVRQVRSTPAPADVPSSAL